MSYKQNCMGNNEQLDINTTEEPVVDLQRNKQSRRPATIQGEDVEVVKGYMHMGLHLTCRLDWGGDSAVLHKTRGGSPPWGASWFLTHVASCSVWFISLEWPACFSMLWPAGGSHVSSGDAKEKRSSSGRPAPSRD